MDTTLAFPSQAYGQDGLPSHACEGGMHLRDWFAGQAFASLFSSDGEFTPEAIARLCYSVADAMLVERAKGSAQ